MKTCSLVRAMMLCVLAFNSHVTPAQVPFAGPITNAANGHWYYLLAPTNWNAAEEIALSLGGHLATINNAAENQWVFDTFSNFGGTERTLWLGFNDAGQENIWFWAGGAPATYVNWAPGEPNNGGGFFPNEDQALIWHPSSGYPHGSWADAPEDQYHAAVVEVSAPEPIILSGPITNSANGHSYYLLNYTNWPGAEQIAVSLGGHLATVNDAAENQWIYNQFSAYGGIERSLWIGLNDAASEGTWVWVSGEPVTYLNWSPIEPNSGGGVFPDEDHAMMWHPSSSFPLASWNDGPSNHMEYAVVEVAPPVRACYSAAADFSTNGNPNGVWRYGYRYSLSGLLKLHEESGALGNLEFWRSEAWQGEPAVLLNPTSTTITNETTVLGPGELTFQPGPDGEYCVIGFTAPLKGLYRLDCQFAGADLAGTTAEVHVIQGGVAVSEGTVNGFGAGSGLTFATNLALRASERVDFVVGYGANGNSSNDATALAAALCWLSNTPPIITSQPADLTVRVSSNATFRVGVVDNEPLAYQWRFNGTNLVARTNSVLELSGVQFNQAGAYSVEVRGSGGAVTSAPAILTVLSLAPPPTITSQPTNVSVYVGGKAAFRVFASGQGPLTYQWRFNNTNLAGATNNILELTGVQVNQAGPYSVQVSNPGGSVVSAQAMLAVQPLPPPPTINGQPTSLTVFVGSNATFRVTATGTAPLAYQWQFNGTNLVGRTSSALALTAVQFNQAGPYAVVVTNVGGAVTSSPAFLTVNPLPPCANVFSNLVSWWRGENSSQDDWDGNNATVFKGLTTATGKVGQAFLNPALYVPDAPSLRFSNSLTIEAWVRPTSISGLQTIISKFDYAGRVPNGTNSSFLLGLTNGRPYFLASTNGVARTNVGILIASQTLTTNQWSHLAASYNGETMRLYVNAQPVGERVHPGRIYEGTNVLGIGVLPYTTSYVQAFSGSIDELTLFARALTPAEIRTIYEADYLGKCLQPPIILAQPQNQSIPLGEDVQFTITASGTKPLRYQWRFNGTNLAGATNSALVLERVQANRTGNYSVFLSNSLGVAISSNAGLSLLAAPTCWPEPAGRISWWPLDGTGEDASGTNRLTFYNGARLVAGKVGSALEFSTNPYAYAVASNHPSLNFGSNADFTIELWIKPSLGDGNYPETPLLDKRILSPTPAGYALSLYRGKLGFWMASSPVAPPVSFISTGPNLRDGMFHHGAVTLNRRATNGGNLYVDGLSVLTFDPTPWNRSLSNSSPFSLSRPFTDIFSPYVGLMDEPAIYNRALTADEILAIRNAGAAGKCKVPPSILVQPVSQRVTIGSNVTFSVTAVGSPALRYQWLKSGAAIPSATNSSFTFAIPVVSPVPLPDSYLFSVRVTNLFGSMVSSNALLTVNHIPWATGASATVNEDASTNIMVTGFDQDPEPITFVVVAPPQHGTLSPFILLPGDAAIFARALYTPAPNYHGPDSFTFKVNDGLVDSAPATVNITILPVNDSPLAYDQSLALDEDTSAAITLAATDVDGDALTYTVGAPAHGQLTGTAPNLVYQPATNYFGPDSFTFTASDGQTNSNVATVSLTVRPVNDAPFARFTVSPLTAFPDFTNQIVLAPLTGDADVALDASASSDVENDPLQFFWWEGTNLFATGMVVTNAFPPATHEVTLVVSDGQATGTNTSTFEVLTPAQSVGLVMSLLENADPPVKNPQPLLASLSAAERAFARSNGTAALNELNAFLNKVQAQIAPTNPELAAKLTQAVELILGQNSPSRFGNGDRDAARP